MESTDRPRRPSPSDRADPYRGGRTGDILQIEILDIDPGPYGFNLNPTTSFVKLGVLADDFPEGKVRWYSVNRCDMTYEFLPSAVLSTADAILAMEAGRTKRAA